MGSKNWVLFVAIIINKCAFPAQVWNPRFAHLRVNDYHISVFINQVINIVCLIMVFDNSLRQSSMIFEINFQNLERLFKYLCKNLR